MTSCWICMHDIIFCLLKLPTLFWWIHRFMELKRRLWKSSFIPAVLLPSEDAAIIASFHCRICFTIYKIYTNALSLVYEPRHRETSSLSLNTTYNGGLIMFKAVYFSEWELCQTGRVHVVPSTDSWASVVPICHLHNCRKSSFPRKFPETMCCGPCSGMFP